MEGLLQKTATISDHKTRTEKYMEIVEEKVASADADSIKIIADHLCSEEVPQAISRKVIAHMASLLPKSLTDEKFEEVADYTVNKIRDTNMASSMDEADYRLRSDLYEHYIKTQDYVSAATALAGINLEASSKERTAEEKADHYVKIAETYMVQDETVDAENFVNKAMQLMGEVKSWQLLLRYKNAHSRVLDSNRKFLDAARNYYDLSQTPATQVDPEELLELLGQATTCAILGKAGPQRDRTLGLLYKDERLANLDTLDGYSTHGKVLSKMYMQQILRHTEMMAFEKSLKDHQKAISGDGMTFCQRAIIEHNMSAAAKIYENIRFTELGTLLEIDEHRAERIAARMISEERLNAYIDQIDGVLYFQDDMDVLRTWDERITGVCLQVNKTVEECEKTYPQIAK